MRALWRSADRWGPGVVALVALLAVVAYGWHQERENGRLEGQIVGLADRLGDRARADVTQGGKVERLASDLAEIQRWRERVREEDKARDEQFRLFRMYVKGRIARLPYRASDDGE